MAIEVVWFKRDLRVRDHQPLLDATHSGLPVLCLAILEPSRWAQPDVDPIHIEWELDVMRALDGSLRRRGTRLTVLVGEAVDVLDSIHQDHGVATIRAHEETGVGWSYGRDLGVASWSKQHGIRFEEYPTNGVIRGLIDRDHWSPLRDARIRMPLLDPPDRIVGIDLGTDIPTVSELGLIARPLTDRPEPGELAALNTARSFLEVRGEPYRWAMSGPVSAAIHASRLGPHLSTGSVSIRRLDRMAEDRLRVLRSQSASGERIHGWIRSILAFRSRLAWHDHFIQKLERQPDLDVVAQNPVLDAKLDRRLDRQRFEAWSEGRTGWPFFDACMRHLTATGWTSFRMRSMMMAVASYTLDLPWRPVGLHLARSFLDYEPGIHWAQVGMQSGTTGINSIRAYGAIKQGQDHDPEGSFIRTWVPELTPVPTAHLHEPWLMPSEVQRRIGVHIGVDYPAPIVDEGPARRDGLTKIHVAKADPEVRQVSEHVARIHGSRAARRRPPPRPARPHPGQPRLFAPES